MKSWNLKVLPIEFKVGNLVYIHIRYTLKIPVSVAKTSTILEICLIFQIMVELRGTILEFKLLYRMGLNRCT